MYVIKHKDRETYWNKLGEFGDLELHSLSRRRTRIYPTYARARIATQRRGILGYYARRGYIEIKHLGA